MKGELNHFQDTRIGSKGKSILHNYLIYSTSSNNAMDSILTWKYKHLHKYSATPTRVIGIHILLKLYTHTKLLISVFRNSE